MARKNLKKVPIDTSKLVKDAKKRGLPKFDEKSKKVRFRLSQFWHDESGKPSKRAFFFSLFSFLGAWYIVFAAFAGDFIGELGMFIISAITVFGVAYHKKVPGIPGMQEQTDFSQADFSHSPQEDSTTKKAIRAVKSTFK